jgi:hypothetical protein
VSAFDYYPLTGAIAAEPISCPDGTTYEIDWDDEGTDYAPAIEGMAA